MFSHLDDKSPPLPNAADRYAVRRRGAHLRRQTRLRRLGVSLTACLAAIVLVGGGIDMIGDPASDIRVATRDSDGSAPAGGAEYPASETSTPPTGPSSVSTEISTTGRPPQRVFGLANSLPPGWQEISPPGYPLLYGRDALTISTRGASTPPASTCDYPMNVLDALGPSDAMVSIVEDPTRSYLSLRPPVEEMIPGPPETADQICYENINTTNPLDFEVRFSASGFRENGRPVRVHVALGPNVSAGRVEEAKAVIQALIVAPKE